LPGIAAAIVKKDGTPCKANEGGFLVVKRPWPSMLRTIFGDHDRYVQTYWSEIPGCYFAGDGARQDNDGYFWIMGRIDDVLNVAGHRLGTMEVESALVAHPRVAEAAVVGKPHEIKGESVFAFVVCRGQRPTGDTSALVKELRDWVAEQVGALAKPDDIRFADNLPKTRSGKIMRRLLKSVARGEEITQDVSTLENPAILDQLRGTDSAKAARPPARKKARKAPARKKRPAKRAPRKQATASKRGRAKPAKVRRAAASRKMRAKMARKVTRRAPAKRARRRPGRR